MPPPDIFISYARADEDIARRYARAFSDAGLKVWWDEDLRSGEVFDQAIEAALRAAKAVVVLWSPSSANSRWVRAEATLADRNKTMVPVTIEQCERPIIFELTHTIDLSMWQGDETDKAWQSLLAELRKIVASHATTGESSPSANARLAQKEPALDHVSIVVLPFANMSRDEDQEYFADGISEDIITDLSKVSALSVIARNTAFTFKGKHVDIPDVARQLNVTHVLEGSVRKASNRVRITAQLIDGSAGDHLWAERYDRDLDDIFALQDEISQAIVAALKLKLLPSEKKAIEDRGTANVEAYDLYIRARALAATLDPDNLARAIAIYREITVRDPGFAAAWAGFVVSMCANGVFDPDGLQSAHEEIDHALAQARRIAPGAGLVIAAETFQALWAYDWARVDSGIEQRLALAEDDTNLSHTLICLGRPKEGAEHQLQRMRADPLSIGTSFVLQYTLDAAGRLDEAEAEYRRCEDLRGNPVMTGWRALTRAMVRGDRARVREIFVERFGDDTMFMPFRPRLIEVLDEPEQALEVLRAAHADPAYANGARQMAIANWAVWFGDIDLALAATRKGLVDQKHGVAMIDIWMPNLAGMRRDPRFKDVLRDIGLAQFWRASGKWGDFARPIGDDDFKVIG